MTLVLNNHTPNLTPLPPSETLSLGKLTITNCKNATIGTKFDCHGNLIVNQYLNVDDCQKEGLTDLKSLFDTDFQKFDWKKFIWKYKYLCILFVVICVVSVVTLSLTLADSKTDTYDNDLDLPQNYTLRLVTRDQWSAKPLTEFNKLDYDPAPYVIVAHTADSGCNRTVVCENLIRATQSYHISIGDNDIAYNFLIGGDGYIYEGIGWGKRGAHTFGFNCDSICVAFMGNFNYMHLRKSMVEALFILLEAGVEMHKLTSNFKMFAQSQVSDMASPGLNVIEPMKKWKHWSVFNSSDLRCV